MTVVAVLVALVVVVWRIRRKHRSQTLAGLNSAKPQFMVEPPLRRLTERKRETL